MKQFAALLATIASVHAIQLEAQAEAEAEFGLGEFFSAGEMIHQFLGSGFFPTEEVAGFIESGDEKSDGEAEADDDSEADKDAKDDDFEEAFENIESIGADAEADEDSEGSAEESDEKDPHSGANSAFANLTNFDFDALIGD